MGRTIKLKKGFDIKLMGQPKEELDANFSSKTFAVKPPNFRGIAPIPKVTVEVGEEVLAGDTLFYDKKRPEIKFASPVSGELVEVKRGDRRAIIELVVLADKENRYRDLGTLSANASREQVVSYLLESGCWPFLRQRPYNVLAESDETPKAIFISGFDTTPLGPNYAYTMQGKDKFVQAGVDVLRKLTPGKVYLSLPAGESYLNNISGAEINSFSGKHPAGNVGVHIHHLNPIAKGQLVWTISLDDLVALGRTVSTGQYNTERLIAVSGAELKSPRYVKTFLGANVENMVKDNLENEHVRLIGGGCLSGTKIESNAHLNFFDNHVAVLDEGDRHEMFGWLLPHFDRPSVSRAFPAFLSPKKKYRVNTNTHGEGRAFVTTGGYEKMIPMDLYPMQLIKSILFRDLDGMEGLGLYEVVEEDLALCEFMCPSKTRFQEILREGLDLMREQG